MRSRVSAVANAGSYRRTSSGAFHACGCRWRAVPPAWNVGAARRGSTSNGDSMEAALLFGGNYNASCSFGRAAPGDRGRIRRSFAVTLRAGWHLSDTRTKRKVWGEESEAERRQSCVRQLAVQATTRLL